MPEIIINLIESALIVQFLYCATLHFHRKHALILSVLFVPFSFMLIHLVNLYAPYEGFFPTAADILLHLILVGAISSLPLSEQLALAMLSPTLIVTINILLASSVSYIFYGQISYPALVANHYLLMVILTKAAYLVLSQGLAACFRRYDHNVSAKYFYAVDLMLFLLNLIFVFYEKIIFENTIDHLLFFFSFLSLTIFIVLIIVMYEKYRQTSIRKTEDDMYSDFRSAQSEWIEQLASKQEELSKLEHDLKHYINSLPPAEHDESASALRKRCEELLTPLIPSEGRLNTVLNVKREEAIQKQIDIRFVISLKKKINISQSDLCLLFSNLLDNAIRYCGGEKQILVEISEISGYTKIRITNSISAPDPGSSERYSSSADRKHGFGIPTIRRIAEQYHGYTRFEKQDSEFVSTVLIPLIQS